MKQENSTKLRSLKQMFSTRNLLEHVYNSTELCTPMQAPSPPNNEPLEAKLHCIDNSQKDESDLLLFLNRVIEAKFAWKCCCLRKKIFLVVVLGWMRCRIYQVGRSNFSIFLNTKLYRLFLKKNSQLAMKRRSMSFIRHSYEAFYAKLTYDIPYN